MAAAAEPLTPRNLGWAALPSESGLTEAQEDFIDYWSPQRVIDDCQAKRVLIARTFDHQRLEDLAEDPAGQLDELLRALVSGRLTQIDCMQTDCGSDRVRAALSASCGFRTVRSDAQG